MTKRLKVPIRLRQGKNTIMVKNTNSVHPATISGMDSLSWSGMKEGGLPARQFSVATLDLE